MNRTQINIISFLVIWSGISVLSASPLAVEFLGMNVFIQDLSVVLTWSTATETENQGFILERKSDSLSCWDPLASYITSDALIGQGTVSSQSDYIYTDSLVTSGETYFYRISGIDNANNIGVLDSLSIFVTETRVVEIIPVDFNLKVYPNPFNPRIVINYQLPAFGPVEINIYNAQGFLVKHLINDMLEAGTYDLIWNASGLSSGIYIVNLLAGTSLCSQKVILMK